MISITISHRVAHHALKIAWPLLAGGMLIPVYHQPWWIKGLAMIPIFFGIMAAMLTASVHQGEGCPLCKGRPRERLERPHYRLWRAYGRYGWALLTLLALGWLVLTAFVESLTKHGNQTLGGRADWIALITLGVMYMSARQFAALNYGFARPRPIRHFVQEHCVLLMHKSQGLIIAALAVNLATVAVAPEKGPWSLFGAGFSLLLFGAVYLSMRHNASLCEVCVEEAEIPVNASEKAASSRYRFTLAHKSSSVLPLAMIVLVTVPHWLSHMGDVVLQGAFDLVVVSSLLLVKWHNAYQPWCPYCGGGGGGGEAEEIPDPAPDHGRPLPVG